MYAQYHILCTRLDVTDIPQICARDALRCRSRSLYHFRVCSTPSLILILSFSFAVESNRAAMIFRKALFQILLKCYLIANVSVLLTSSNAAVVASGALLLNDNSTRLTANESSLYNTSAIFTGGHTPASPVCDLKLYGPVIVESCMEALARLKAIGPPDKVFTWADEGYGQEPHIQIPYRFSSYESGFS